MRTIEQIDKEVDLLSRVMEQEGRKLDNLHYVVTNRDGATYIINKVKRLPHDLRILGSGAAYNQAVEHVNAINALLENCFKELTAEYEEQKKVYQRLERQRRKLINERGKLMQAAPNKSGAGGMRGR